MPLTDPKPVPKFGEPGYVIPSQERKKREKKNGFACFSKSQATYLLPTKIFRYSKNNCFQNNYIKINETK